MIDKVFRRLIGWKAQIVERDEKSESWCLCAYVLGRIDEGDGNASINDTGWSPISERSLHGHQWFEVSSVSLFKDRRVCPLTVE